MDVQVLEGPNLCRQQEDTKSHSQYGYSFITRLTSYEYITGDFAIGYALFLAQKLARIEKTLNKSTAMTSMEHASRPSPAYTSITAVQNCFGLWTLLAVIKSIE